MKNLFILMFILASSLFASTPLEYLNQKRSNVGMIPFKENYLLNHSSYNHAKYMIENSDYGHYETSSLPYFTGEIPSDRAVNVNYNVHAVSENLTVGYKNYTSSIDALFTAIYHRLGFLNFDDNEIGMGEYVDHSGNISAHVYNLGDSNLVDLCNGVNFSGDDNYIYGLCKDESFRIEMPLYYKTLEVNPSLNPKIVIWPYENQEDFQPAFYEESPDPMPECSITGNPISIQFNDAKSNYININHFKLFDSLGNEIHQTKLLTSRNDPNKQLSSNDFVLFPLKRLNWGSNYSVEFSYFEGERKIKKWNFRTRKLNYPLYKVNDNEESFLVKPNKDYAIYIPPKDCNDNRYDYDLEKIGLVEVNKNDSIDSSTLIFNISGNIGDKLNIIMKDGRKVTLQLSLTDRDDLPSVENKTYELGKEEFIFRSLNLENDSNIDITNNFNSKVTIYDNMMNIVNIIDYSNKLQYLKKGQYIIKIENKYNYSSSKVLSTFFINELNKENLESVKNNKYLISNEVKYMTLNVNDETNLDIVLNSTMDYVIIYDEKMNLIKKITKHLPSSSYMNLVEGKYIVKIVGGENSEVNFFSPQLEKNDNFGLLTKKRLNVPKGLYYYYLDILNDSIIDFNFNEIIAIYDEEMKKQLYLSSNSSSSTISLSKGRYIVKLLNENNIEERFTSYTSSLDNYNTLDKLESKKYSNLDGVSYYSLSVPYRTNLDISNHSYTNVTIYDIDLNIIYKESYDYKFINLHKGEYIIKLSNVNQHTNITFFSPFLVEDETLLPLYMYEKKSSESIEFYTLELSSTSLIDVNIESYASSTFYDESFEIVNKCFASCQIELRKGNYIVKADYEHYGKIGFSYNKLQDFDNDGIPDTYESLNKLDLRVFDSHLDFDNDGKTNLEEYLDYTDPQNENSKMYELNLLKGWNLVSFEYDTILNTSSIKNEDIEVIFGFNYDINTSKMDWKYWSSIKAIKDERRLNNLKDGYGYWIKVKENTKLKLRADDILRWNNRGVSTYHGEWNLHGSKEVTNFDEFFYEYSSQEIVWLFRNGKYYALSKDQNTNKKLIENNIPLINKIFINEGFFIK